MIVHKDQVERPSSSHEMYSRRKSDKAGCSAKQHGRKETVEESSHCSIDGLTETNCCPPMVNAKKEAFQENSCSMGKPNTEIGLTYVKEPRFKTRRQFIEQRKADNIMQLQASLEAFLNRPPQEKACQGQTEDTNETRTRSKMKEERKKNFILEAAKFKPKENEMPISFSTDNPWWCSDSKEVLPGACNQHEISLPAEVQKGNCARSEILLKRDQKKKIAKKVTQTQQSHCPSPRCKKLIHWTDVVIEFRDKPSICDCALQNKYDLNFKAPFYSSFTPDGLFHESLIPGFTGVVEKTEPSVTSIDRSSQAKKRLVSRAINKRLELDNRKKNGRKKNSVKKKKDDAVLPQAIKVDNTNCMQAPSSTSKTSTINLDINSKPKCPRPVNTLRHSGFQFFKEIK